MYRIEIYNKPLEQYLSSHRMRKIIPSVGDPIELKEFSSNSQRLLQVSLLKYSGIFCMKSTLNDDLVPSYMQDLREITLNTLE